MTQQQLIDRISHHISLLKFYRERPRWLELDYLMTLESLAHTLETDVGNLKTQVAEGCPGCKTLSRPNRSLKA